jgi:hypothetical protein
MRNCIPRSQYHVHNITRTHNHSPSLLLINNLFVSRPQFDSYLPFLNIHLFGNMEELWTLIIQDIQYLGAFND